MTIDGAPRLRQVAVPLKGGPHRAVSMVMLCTVLSKGLRLRAMGGLFHNSGHDRLLASTNLDEHLMRAMMSSAVL